MSHMKMKAINSIENRIRTIQPKANRKYNESFCFAIASILTLIGLVYFPTWHEHITVDSNIFRYYFINTKRSLYGVKMPKIYPQMAKNGADTLMTLVTSPLHESQKIFVSARNDFHFVCETSFVLDDDATICLQQKHTHTQRQ